MQIQKTEDGQSVQVLRTLKKPTPEQVEQEAELQYYRNALSEVAGFLFKVRTRCSLKQYPCSTNEVDQLVKVILDIPDQVKEYVEAHIPHPSENPVDQGSEVSAVPSPEDNKVQ